MRHPRGDLIADANGDLVGATDRVGFDSLFEFVKSDASDTSMPNQLFRHNSKDDQITAILAQIGLGSGGAGTVF